MEAIRVAAFHANVSTSTQIRSVLDLPVAARPKRPRLTVTLDAADYALLASRYGLAPDDRLGIKEAATRELIGFVQQQALHTRSKSVRTVRNRKTVP